MLQWCYLFRKINYAFSLVLLVQGLCITAPKRPRKNLRLLISTIGIFVYSYFMLEAWQWDGMLVVATNIRYNFAVQVSIAVLVFCQMLLCYTIKPWDAAFFMVITVYMQKIHFNIYIILDRGLINPNGSPLSTDLLAALYILTLLPIVYLGSRVYGKNRVTVYNSEDNHGLILATIGVSLLDNFYEQHLFTSDPYANMGLTMITSRIFSIATLLLILYLLHTILLRKSLQNEKQALSMMCAQRSQQLDSQRELMQSINVQSHDLKKLTSYLRGHEFEKEQLLEQIEKDLQEYDCMVNTRNEALSLILTEKSLAFRRNQVTFSCTVCENDFRFMADLDIYTLFANLLDNALEASLKIQPENRNVLLIVKERDNFLSIHQENYFDGVFSLDDGLPVTTKADTLCHGYGTRSIAQIVERYDGSLKYDLHGNICRINILFPL